MLAVVSALIPRRHVDFGTALLGGMVFLGAVNLALVALVALLIAAVRRRIRAWQLCGVVQAVNVWVAAVVIATR